MHKIGSMGPLRGPGSEGSEGSKGSEGGGGGFAAGCVEGLWKKVLKIDRPLAGGFVSLTAFQAEGCGGALRAQIIKKAGPPPPVISTEAGQPPIGKPLIVQARGQLRLTWRLYAESPQSGEISLHHGT